MNFLAHLYLSGGFDEVMVGNLMGDFTVGRIDATLPAGVQRGIRLHREIDSFTDAHPVVRAAKHRLFPAYRHYAAVITDVFYDHFLALHWQDYDAGTLGDFAGQVHRLFAEKEHLLPEAMLPMVRSMAKHNWLPHYATLEGIDRALTRMARRTKFVSGMENATGDLHRDYAFYDENFRRFFPDLIRHADEFRKADA